MKINAIWVFLFFLHVATAFANRPAAKERIPALYIEAQVAESRPEAMRALLLLIFKASGEGKVDSIIFTPSGVIVVPMDGQIIEIADFYLTTNTKYIFTQEAGYLQDLLQKKKNGREMGIEKKGARTLSWGQQLER